MDNDTEIKAHMDNDRQSDVTPPGQRSDDPGAVKAAYSVGQAGTPGQGPHMLIVLRVEGICIAEARFSTYGCPAAVACGQFVAEQVEGKSCRDVEDMDEAFIIAGVGAMPLGREHCPPMAVRALRDALAKLSAADP